MSRTTLLFAAVALAGWGTGPLFDKLALRGLSAAAAVTMRSVFASVVLLGYGAISGSLQDIGRASITPVLFLLASTVLSPVIGNFAYLKALKEAEASRIVPITAAYPLVAATLAIIFLAERLTAPKVVGAVLIVAGIVLISGVGRAQ